MLHALSVPQRTSARERACNRQRAIFSLRQAQRLQPADQRVDHVVAGRGRQAVLDQGAHELRAGDRSPVGADQDARDRGLDRPRRRLGDTAASACPGPRDRTRSAGARASSARTCASAGGMRAMAVGDAPQLGGVGDRPVAQIGLRDRAHPPRSALTSPCSVRARSSALPRQARTAACGTSSTGLPGATLPVERAVELAVLVQAAGQIHLRHADRGARLQLAQHQRQLVPPLVVRQPAQVVRDIEQAHPHRRLLGVARVVEEARPGGGVARDVLERLRHRRRAAASARRATPSGAGCGRDAAAPRRCAAAAAGARRRACVASDRRSSANWHMSCARLGMCGSLSVMPWVAVIAERREVRRAGGCWGGLGRSRVRRWRGSSGSAWRRRPGPAAPSTKSRRSPARR